MSLLLADVGNSRVKLARASGPAETLDVVALPTDDPSAWDAILRRDGLVRAGDRCYLGTVHPAAADELAGRLAGRGVVEIVRIVSAADVPVRQALREPARTGADRALALLAALDRVGGRGPLRVVMCGTAVTVEHVDASGCWLGGAILPGLRSMAVGLNRSTAQLPEVRPAGEAVPAWSDHTEGALAAGLTWGLVGAVRELLARQGDAPVAPIVWTGGDAAWIARAVEGEAARVEPDLVLRGIARLSEIREGGAA